MAADSTRVEAYKAAISRAGLRGKVVLDLGCGPEALLARLCLDAGRAARVVAVEVVRDAAEKARALLDQLPEGEHIDVLSGFAATTLLPRVDTVVHEIVGNIGSEEGLAGALADLRGRPEVVDSTKPGWCIPRLVETLVAPWSLHVPSSPPTAGRRPRSTTGPKPKPKPRLRRPSGLGDDAACSAAQEVAACSAAQEGAACSAAQEDAACSAAQEGAASAQAQAPARTLPFAPPPMALLGRPQVFEVLDAEAPVELNQRVVLRWKIRVDEAAFTGVVCAPRIRLDSVSVIDPWVAPEGCSWRHVLVPLKKPTRVKRGDVIEVKVASDLRRMPVVHTFDFVVFRKSGTEAKRRRFRRLGSAVVKL